MEQACDLKSQGVVVAFDAREDTFRHEKYLQYKANRRKVPESFDEDLNNKSLYFS